MEDAGYTPIPAAVLAEDNAYLSSSELSTLEAEVLGEYARLAGNLEKLADIANKLAATQPEIMHAIVPLEKKLGLVLTLFKASVWATYVAREAREENEEHEEQQRQQQQQQQQRYR